MAGVDGSAVPAGTSSSSRSRACGAAGSAVVEGSAVIAGALSRTRASGRRAAAAVALLAGLTTLAMVATFAGQAAALTVLPTGTSSYLNNVKFVTTNVGWAVGASGTIESTVDGGAHWASQNSGTSSDLTGIDAISTSTAWAVGLDGVILSTSNGGSSWQKRTSGTSDLLLGVDFVDASRGWAVGDNGTILTSGNGGLTWSKQTSFKTDLLTAVSFRDSQHGLVVGDLRGTTTGSVLRTVDGGVHWTAVSTPASATMYDVTDADATHAWVVGDNGSVLKSTNDGASWSQKNSDTNYALDAVSFNGVSNGIAVGSPDNGSPYHAVLLVTSDGGESWTKRDTGTTDYLYGSAFPSAGRAYAVGDNGRALSLDMTAPSGGLTINGGAAWTASRTVTLGSSVSGATEMRFRNSGGTWGAWAGYSSSAALDLVGPDGTCAVEAEYRSTEGTVFSASDQIGLDMTAPATTDNAPSGWQGHNVIVQLTASDAGSGVNHTEYNVDGGAWQTGTSVTVLASVDESNNGIHTIAYRSLDNLGQTEPTRTCVVKIWVSKNGSPPVEPTVATATISGGALSITTPMVTGNFACVLTGAAQTIHAASAQGGASFSDFTVSDPRGIGVGWSVTLKATQFVNGSNPGRDLAINSLSVPMMVVTKADSGSSTPPAAVQHAVTIDGVSDPVEIASCVKAGDGMGSYTFVQGPGGWALSLSAAEYAGMYTSTVTTTLATEALSE